MFTWITIHVINEYLYNVRINEDENNSPKENAPPPLPVPYLKIYPIVVPKITVYDNNSHFVFVFFDVVYA